MCTHFDNGVQGIERQHVVGDAQSCWPDETRTPMTDNRWKTPRPLFLAEPPCPDTHSSSQSHCLSYKLPLCRPNFLSHPVTVRDADFPFFPLFLAWSVLYFLLFHLSFWTFYLFLCSFSVRRHAHVDFQLFSQKSSGIPVTVYWHWANQSMSTL